jgi:putative peptidoglycan lipid II flippase
VSTPAPGAPGEEATAPSPAAAPPAPSSRGGLARSAGVIGIATMTSRVLALVREQVIAYLFGAGNAVDAYNVAFRIPNLVRDLFAEGAMSAAFVPTFTRTLSRDGKEAAWRLGRQVVTALLLATGLLVILGVVFAPALVRTFAGSFAEVPGKLELTVLLTRLMLPFLMMVAVAAAFMGMLNSLNRFFVPALSPAMFNVGSLVCLLALVPLVPAIGWPPITAAAIGVLVGGLGQAALQWPMLRREGFRYRPALDLRDPGLQRVLILMGPGTLGLAATQINVFVNTVLATGEGTGAVSWLNYAFRLMYLPLGIIGVSIATAAIPAISRHAARDDLSGVRKEVAGGLSMMLLLNVPATLGLIVLARPIVALLFERGQFSAADTDATALALICYAVGLTGYSAVKIASPTFYALHESRTPVLVSVGSVAVNVALNLVLVRYLSYYGLALGTSITALLNAGLLLTLLRRRLGGLEGRRLFSVLVRTVVAALVMAGAAWGLERTLVDLVPGRSLAAQLVHVSGSIAGALIVLAMTTRLLGLHEFTTVIRSVVKRVLPNKR